MLDFKTQPSTVLTTSGNYRDCFPIGVNDSGDVLFITGLGDDPQKWDTLITLPGPGRDWDMVKVYRVQGMGDGAVHNLHLLFAHDATGPEDLPVLTTERAYPCEHCGARPDKPGDWVGLCGACGAMNY